MGVRPPRSGASRGRVDVWLLTRALPIECLRSNSASFYSRRSLESSCCRPDRQSIFDWSGLLLGFSLELRSIWSKARWHGLHSPFESAWLKDSILDQACRRTRVTLQ